MAVNKAWCEKQAVWCEKQAVWHTEQIAWINEQIARERKADRDLVKWVLAKGVLTRNEIELFGDPAKFISQDTEEYKRQRRREYKWRKYYRDKAQEFREKAARA